MSGATGAAGPATLLVVSDTASGPGATQKISFGQPFEANAAAYQVEFGSQDEAPEAIDRMFERFRPSFLVLSRCTSENGQAWIARARRERIPAIFHIDDDLLSVPPSLGAAKLKAYSDPKRISALRANIEACDLLYVSTPFLKERFARYGFSVPVVAGDIYCSVSPSDVGPLIPPATGPVAGYMGSGGHSADFAMIVPAICRVMEAIPDMQFEIFGRIDIPAELAAFGSRVRNLPPVRDYANFLPELRSLGWWVGVAPLEDNPFNCCKADTKWVEYSLSGMAVVASRLRVYERACADGAGILAATSREWEEAMLTLLCVPEQRAAMIAQAQARLRADYTHQRLQAQVVSVLDRAREEHRRRGR